MSESSFLLRVRFPHQPRCLLIVRADAMCKALFTVLREAIPRELLLLIMLVVLWEQPQIKRQLCILKQLILLKVGCAKTVQTWRKAEFRLVADPKLDIASELTDDMLVVKVYRLLHTIPV